MRTRLSSARFSCAALVLTVLALIAIHIAIEPMWFTGDEPQYASSGLGLYTNGELRPSPETWNAFVTRSGLPKAPYAFTTISERRAQSLAPGIVFGPALLRFGLNAARWLNLAIGTLGICVLFALLRRGKTSDLAGALTIATVVLSIPFIAYARLLYPEILLFTTVACALFALESKRFALLAVAAGLLPFEHVRALPLSLAFIGLAIAALARSQQARNRIVRLCAVYAVAIVLWSVAQVHVYGTLLGPAFSTNAPSLPSFASRLELALLDVRHGLLTYSPIFLMALAGIVAGAFDGDARYRRCAVLLVVYVGTFMWSSAGESWSARFWVAALPMLGVGLSFGLARISTWPARLTAGTLGAITLANTIVYAIYPMWYVTNRTSAIAYDAMASYVHLDIGEMFPVDALKVTYDDHSVGAWLAIAGSLVTILALWIHDPHAGSRSRRSRTS